MDFSQLFDTVDTVAPDTGSGVFTLQHFAVLTVIGGIIYLIARRFKRADAAGRQKILTATALFAMVNEVLKDAYLAGLGVLGWGHLPLHLCGINIIVIGLYWWTKRPKLAEWLYAMSLPGGLVALLSPDWGELPVMNIMFWQTNTIHAALVLFPILLLIDGLKPDGRRFIRLAPWLFVIGGVIYPLNKLLGTNFLFMNWAPIGTPFEVFEDWLGNPGYLLGFVGVMALVWGVMYLPWRRKSQRAGAKI